MQINIKASLHPPETSLTFLIMQLFSSIYLRYFSATLCGSFITLTFSPFEQPLALFPALSGLFILLLKAETRRHAFFTGWWFGMGMYVSGLYWISNALLVDAERFAWLIPFAVIGLNGVLALYSAALGLIMHRLRNLSPPWQWGAFATSWGALEILRSTLFTGFPWNLLGYSLVFSPELMQLARPIPIPYLSAALVALGSLPALYWLTREQPKTRRTTHIIAVLLATLSAGGYYYGHSTLTPSSTIQTKPYDSVQTEPIYAILQGNIEQSLKSHPEHRANHLQTYISLMKEARTEALRQGYSEHHPLTFIWPETAFPYLVDESGRWSGFLGEIIRDNEAIISGVVRKEDGHYYNSVAIIQKGKAPLFYDKEHLVPFGEYVPLRNFLPIERIVPGFGDFGRGKGGKMRNIALPHTEKLSFSALICYEAIFAKYATSPAPNTSALINLTNDGWFGDSIGPHQHLMMSRFRAVEQRTPLIRAANNGISALIDPFGHIQQNIPLNKRGILITPLPAPKH